MTSHDLQLAKTLGIQPCHVHANQLVDQADAKDRVGYRAHLDKIEAKHGRHYRDLVNELATRQVHMQTRYHTHNPWRVAWKEHHRNRSSE
ncbi:hypothetical protein [uncultured Marinobacter sp.]|uniref:hypothetical protein n=1 Tax=uncultured Marinobacter sp. TaxID=187379 RepID=UPI00258C9310|nr:hypothetical protein [uncultured Marinobacter sp.]